MLIAALTVCRVCVSAVHEKSFSLLLGSCFVYMVAQLAVEREAFPAMSVVQRTSHRRKVAVATLYASLIIGLLYYFWKHRFYCEELGEYEYACGL